MGKHTPRRILQPDLSFVFWHACLNGNFNIVQSCIGKGININAEVDGFVNKINGKGYTGLHLVCSISDKTEERASIVNLMLSNTTNVDPVDKVNGHTPLHWACNKGLFEIVKQLVKHGADVTRADNVGRTPLHFAQAQNFEIIMAFIEGVILGKSLV